MEYTVITSNSLQDLIKEVSDMVGKGWMLEGGMTFVCNGDNCKYDYTYAQTLTRGSLREV